MNEDAVPCARGRLLEFVQGIREGDVAFAQELDECGAVWCYSSLILVAGQLESAISIDKRELAALSDIAWEQLHTGYWKDVPCAWRNLYALTCIFKAYLELHERADVATSIKELDMALLMGDARHADFITAIISILHTAKLKRVKESVEEGPARGTKRKRSDPWTEPVLGASLIARVRCPSTGEFRGEPIIITGAVDHWPALNGAHDWRNLDYLKSVAGMRTVPVELGKEYTSSNWGQDLMPLSTFIDTHIDPDSSPDNVGYLAQTPLFDQIPELRRDIIVPEYCSVLPSADAAEDARSERPAINAWFGPRSTVSPLHFDPDHNLLTQIVGRKYIRLYAPEETGNLYPHDAHLLRNTSQVDVEHPNLERFPDFENAKFTELVLERGEMLYIPPQHWHYVRSLSISFSVSFWWNRRD